jgi:hypothetical protein
MNILTFFRNLNSYLLPGYMIMPFLYSLTLCPSIADLANTLHNTKLRLKDK